MDTFTVCDQCGQPIQPKSPGGRYKFCLHCGADLAQVKQETPPMGPLEIGQPLEQNLIQFDNSSDNTGPSKADWIFTLIVAAFIGLMTATAGGALYPPLIKLTSPITCPQGNLVISSQDYSYRPGSITRMSTATCESPQGPKQDIGFYCMLVMFSWVSVCSFLILASLRLIFQR